MKMQVAIAFPLFVSATAAFNRFSLANVDEAAVCTDGSPAGYYYSPHFNPEPASVVKPSTTWLVYLEGGGWCYSEADCNSRCGTSDEPKTHALCSSTQWPEQLYLGGIFWPSGETDATRAANKVMVKYCTSDAHMGNSSAFGKQFRGKVVVQAVLKDLVARHGLGAGPEKHLLIFGGGSAGARGGMVHLDYVKEMLGSSSSNVDVVGFLDSPLWIDFAPPPNSSFPGFMEITRRVHSFANVEHLGESCAAMYAPQDQWKCLFGEYRLPHVKTPYFMVASQYDGYQIGNLLQHQPSSDADHVYAEAFATKTVAFIKSLKQMFPQNGMYSWACYNHMMSVGDHGFNSMACHPDTTMKSALEQFLGAAPHNTSPELEWIDNCTTFSCGSGCGGESLLVV